MLGSMGDRRPSPISLAYHDPDAIPRPTPVNSNAFSFREPRKNTTVEVSEWVLNPSQLLTRIENRMDCEINIDSI